jgi:hypothetical protein
MKKRVSSSLREVEQMTRDGATRASVGVLVLAMGAYSCIIEDLTIIEETPDGGAGPGGGASSGAPSGSGGGAATGSSATDSSAAASTTASVATGVGGMGSTSSGSSAAGAGGASNPTGWTYAWSGIFGDVEDEKVAKIAVDGAGDAVFTGEFRANLMINMCSLTSPMNASRDGFAAKVSGTDGACKWAEAFGDSSYHQYGTGVALNGSGNPYLAGNFSGSISFDGQGSQSTTAGFNGYVTMLAAASGAFDGWSQALGENTSDQFVEAIASAPGGSSSAVAVGYFKGNIPAVSGCPQLTGSASADNVFVIKVTDTGTCEWAWHSGDNSSYGDRGRAAAMDGSGNVYITGKYQGSPIFGCIDKLTTDAMASDDLFVAKLDNVGSCLWVRGYGNTTHNQEGTSIAVDPQGGIYVGGFFKGTFTIGSDTLTASGAGDDLFIAKLDPSGAPLWATRLGDSLSQKIQAIAVDPLTNRVVATGTYSGQIVSPGFTLVAPSLGFGIFLLEFDRGTGLAEGGLGWGVSGVSEGVDVKFDNAGDLLLAGNTTGSIDLGGGVLTTHGKLDLVIAKFTRP